MKSKSLTALMILLFSGLVAWSYSDDDYGITLGTSLPEGEFVVYKGEEVSLRFTPDFDGFVTLLAIDKKSNVRIIFPNERQEDNYVRAGETVRIRGIYADYTGPVYIQAITTESPRFEFRYRDRECPIWDEDDFGRFSSYRSFLSDKRGYFTISFDDEISRRRKVRYEHYDEEELEDELQERVDDDYDDFEAIVERFRDDISEVLDNEDYATAYVDLYIASDRFDPAAYRGGYGEGDYEPPVYSSYYDYEPDRFDYQTALSGYGSWIELGGIRVWRPPVFSFGWRPFLHGYWSSTAGGWYWTGYEPFAWCVYHYGYWNYDSYYGWFWIPDTWNYRFTPANCYWYSFGDYYSWYPAPVPSRIAARLHIDVSIHFDLARAVVVHRRDFMRHDISAVVAAPKKILTKLRGVKPDFRAAAPAVRSVEKAVGRAIKPIKLKTITKVSAKGGKKVVIMKPLNPKAPPKVFRDLDRKVKHKMTSRPRKATLKAPAGKTTKAGKTAPKARSPRRKVTLPPRSHASPSGKKTVHTRPSKTKKATPKATSKTPSRETKKVKKPMKTSPSQSSPAAGKVGSKRSTRETSTRKTSTRKTETPSRKHSVKKTTAKTTAKSPKKTTAKTSKKTHVSKHHKASAGNKGRATPKSYTRPGATKKQPKKSPGVKKSTKKSPKKTSKKTPKPGDKQLEDKKLKDKKKDASPSPTP